MKKSNIILTHHHLVHINIKYIFKYAATGPSNIFKFFLVHNKKELQKWVHSYYFQRGNADQKTASKYDIMCVENLDPIQKWYKLKTSKPFVEITMICQKLK